MNGFTKLFSSIITSSIWSEDDKTRVMWITLLAAADAQGFVSGTIPGMAAIARMSVEDTERCLNKLSNPDPYSRTPDHEGRRIEAVQGGWRLLNYKKYREQRDPEKRREQNREAQQRWRERHRKPNVSQCKPKQKTEAEGRSRSRSRRQKQKACRQPSAPFVPPTPAEVDEYAASIGYIRPNLGRDFVQKYEARNWCITSGEKMENWKLVVQTWRRTDELNPQPQAKQPAEPTPLARGADGLTPRQRALRQKAGAA